MAKSKSGEYTPRFDGLAAFDSSERDMDRTDYAISASRYYRAKGGETNPTHEIKDLDPKRRDAFIEDESVDPRDE